MSAVIRQRLYLSARFLAALLAVAVIGVRAVVGVHDYAVQQADWRCYVEQWNEGIKKAREQDAARMTRNCTPTVVTFLAGRDRAQHPGETFDTDTHLAKDRPLTAQEEECFWSRGVIVLLPTEEVNRIERRCNVREHDLRPDPRFPEQEMVRDLRAARAAGDKELEHRISRALAAGRALPGRPELVPPEDLPDELQKLSTRAWRPGPGQGHGWREDAMLAMIALVPLLLLVGVRRWIVWLTKAPEP